VRADGPPAPTCTSPGATTASGWPPRDRCPSVVYGGEEVREGYLKRGDQVVEASMYGGEKARIIRTETDP